MRKFLAALFLLMPVTATAGVTDYQRGIQDGIKIGIQFEKEKLSQELSSVKQVALESLNYKYYFLKGEVPPPLMVTKLVEQKTPSGYAVLNIKTEVLPPAYFPVTLFQQVRKDYFDGGVVVIPSGNAVFLDTRDLPTETIAYYKWLAETAGYSPVYDYFHDRLFFSVRDREADAEADKKYLTSIGIPDVEVGELKKPIEVKTPQVDLNLAEEIKKTAREILEKEKKVAGLKVNEKGATINDVVVNLQKALAAVQALDPKRYDRLNLYRLEEDLENILSNLGQAVALQEKYDAVVITTKTDEPSVNVKKEAPKRVFPEKVKSLTSPPIERLKKIEEMLE